MKRFKIIVGYALPILALALIGTGSWFMYKPAAPVVVGSLIWLDMYLETK